jgi:hypothetical protein
VQSYKTSQGGKKYRAMCGDKKVWSSRKVRKSDRLQKEIKVWSPYCGRKGEALQVVKLNNVV